MKKNYLFKTLLSGLIIASGTFANAQCVHPISYSAGAGGSSFYNAYVGERFEITNPPAIAGDKIFTTPNDGSGATGSWGGFPGTGSASAIVNAPMIAYPSDSCVTSAPVTIDMTGKVALVYRGAGVQFGTKALRCMNAGAIACVIVNNVGGGPVGMAAGTDGASVTIPVFMVSKADGDLMDQQLDAGTTVSLTVVNWGQGLVNDLGFVSRGIAQWHNGAIPAYELTAGGDPLAYRGFDGAYIGNFGSATATNVKLTAATSFTPTGGSATVVHTDSVTLASFPQTDSIWAMFCPQYNLGQYVTGTGTINVNYNLSAAGFIDQFPFDNSTSYSVQVTDNIYTKGRWDAVNNEPVTTFYTGTGLNTAGSYDPYLWGPSFYINKSRYANNSMFSIVVGTSTGVDYVIPSSSVNIYLFKWVDGVTNGTVTYPMDSMMQNGEFLLQGMGTVTFNGTTDSSFKYYTVYYGDSAGNYYNVLLDSNSWYWVAAEMPQSGTTNYSIGCDGVNNGYPRLYGRDTFDHYLEYYSPLWSSGDKSTSTYNMYAYSNYDCSIVPFGGTSLVTSLDSVIFSNEKGLIPNISLATSPYLLNTPTVKQVFAEFTLYPNPATQYITANVGFDNTVKDVTYKVMNTSGKVISSETHTNVQNEKYTFATDKLANGVYYMIVTADGKSMFKKFTVIR